MQKDIKDMSNEELLQYRKQKKNDIAKYHTFQLARKIQLNSAFGAVG
jgi:ribosomal protein L29